MTSHHADDRSDLRRPVPLAPAVAGGGSLADPLGLGEGLFGLDGPRQPGPANPLNLAFLLRSKWLILGIFVLLSGATIPLIWLFLEPIYKSTAVVRVSPVVSRLLFKTEDNGMIPLYTSFLNTQVSIIRSPTVLQRVLDEERVRQTQWYRKPPRTPRTMLGGTPPSDLERLQKDLSVSPRRNTELIDVSMTTKSSTEAKLIADIVVNTYKSYVDETARQRDTEKVSVLRQEYSQQRKQYKGLTDTLHQISKPLGTVTPDEVRTQLTTQLNALQNEYETLQRQQAMTRWELDALPAAEKQPAADGEGEEAQAGSGEDVDLLFAGDPEWQQRKSTVEDARHRLASAGQIMGESHPRMQQLRLDMEYARKRLHDREAELRAAPRAAGPLPPDEGGTLFRTRDALEWIAKKQEHALTLLAGEIEQRRGAVTEAGERAREIAEYEEQIRHTQGVLEEMRSRLLALEMESNAPASISVAAHAVAASEPARDRRLLLTVMALGAAMMAGLATAYLRTTLDPRIREVVDVRYTVRVPFLGQVPALPSSRKRSSESPLMVESIRIVRTALLERLDGSGGNSVLITSSSSRSGKTSVAIQLARSLAQVGKRTLLVEADLRRADLAARLGLQARIGLARLLTNGITDRDVIVPSEVPRLDVLPAGERPEGFNAELLANGVFARCLARWKQMYDIVLLDSPPVLPVADSRILAAQADGTVMVLRASHTRRAEVAQAYEDLTAAGGTLLGTVLVGVRLGQGFGYQYHEYYSDAHTLADGPSQADS